MGPMTSYAQKQLRQKGFSALSLRIIDEFAELKRERKDGAMEVFMSKKKKMQAIREFKRAIQELSKTQGASLIIRDGLVITALKNNN